MRTPLLAALLLLAPPALAAQQTQPPTPPQPPLDCTAAEYRQLDFWVGDWDVYIGENKVGTNRVTSEEKGCIVHEHWTGGPGGTGQSFNFYDRLTRKWRQVWVSSNGSTLDVQGNLVDGTMAYAGEVTRKDGTKVMQKLSFTPNPDGTVRQFWQTSVDGGVTWNSVWDGRYVRQGKK